MTGSFLYAYSEARRERQSGLGTHDSPFDPRDSAARLRHNPTMPTPHPEPTPQPTTLLLGIRGMHCASCVTKIETALQHTPGVLRASVNLASEEALIDYLSTQASQEDLRMVIVTTGGRCGDRVSP